MKWDDLHTHEKTIVLKIKDDVGFTDWWISEHEWRITALEKLIKAGVVWRTGGDYPFASYDFDRSIMRTGR